MRLNTIDNTVKPIVFVATRNQGDQNREQYGTVHIRLLFPDLCTRHTHIYTNTQFIQLFSYRFFYLDNSDRPKRRGCQNYFSKVRIVNERKNFFPSIILGCYRFPRRHLHRNMQIWMIYFWERRPKIPLNGKI